MIKPISGMSYVGKFDVCTEGTTVFFDWLFDKFYEYKPNKLTVDVKYFRVNDVTEEELKFLEEKYPNLKELLFNKVKDFVIINNDFACGDVEASIMDNGIVSIDMSKFDEDAPTNGYDGFQFIVDIDFNKPIGKVEINK